MLSNIKAAIFDVDGTLLDSNGVWHQIDIDFMKERNMSHPDNLQNWLDGLSFNQVAEFFHEKFNTKETPEELVEIWHNKAYDAYKNTVKAKKGAKKLLSHLKDNNVKTAIVTSNSHELIEAGLKNNGLYDYIDLVITADSLNTNKDTPYIFQETARRLDVEPEYIIVFDDLYPVIKAVNDANMRSVAVYDKRSIKAYGEELIRETADYYIKDFTEVL